MFIKYYFIVMFLPAIVYCGSSGFETTLFLDERAWFRHLLFCLLWFTVIIIMYWLACCFQLVVKFPNKRLLTKRAQSRAQNVIVFRHSILRRSGSALAHTLPRAKSPASHVYNNHKQMQSTYILVHPEHISDISD